jgi:hypothetical protein
MTDTRCKGPVPTGHSSPVVIPRMRGLGDDGEPHMTLQDDRVHRIDAHPQKRRRFGSRH